MSIEALNWARKTYVGDALGKSVLRAIADYADENGYGFPSLERIADDCDLSKDSVRRRLKSLEEQGLLTTVRCWSDEHGKRNHNQRGRETTRDIYLPLKLVRTRPSDDEDSADKLDTPLAGSHPPLASSEGSQQQGAPSSPARGGVALVPPPNELPSNEDSPPNPPPGGGVPIDDVVRQQFATSFWPIYPEHRVMDEQRALQEFAKVAADERLLACAALPHYATDLKKAQRKPKDAYKFLRDRIFAQYQFAQSAAPAAPGQPVWVDDPDALVALKVLRAIAGQPEPFSTERGGKRGVFHPVPVGADIRGLLAFAGTDELDWLVLKPGTPEFSAWRARIHEWTGRWIDPERVVLRRGMHKISIPGQPDREARNREKGLPVPCRWPPRKDGTIIEGDGGER